jgi:hypothetical protein
MPARGIRGDKSMIHIFALTLFALPFVASFLAGYWGWSILIPIAIAAYETVQTMRDGWREGSIVGSFLKGMLFMGLSVVPLFFVGQWMAQ